MNEVKIFENKEFGKIRTVQLNNEIYFVGKDVADKLGYQNGSRDINRHVAEEDRTKDMIFDGNQNKETILINESGLYSLILSSKLESAKRFKHWVTSEVLPSLRKNGGYIVGQEQMTPEQIMAAGLKVAESIIAQKEKEIERMRPKEIFADAVASSSSSILIGDLAKILKQNGLETGQKRLFEKLREDGYLIKSGSSKNMPTQRAIEMGLFEVKETTISNPDGSIRVTKTTKVTGKGQQYFINRFLGT